MLDVVTLLDLVQQGWYATYPLLLCSVVALAIAGERLWALRGLDARMISVSKQIGFLMRRGDVEGAADLLEREGPDLPLSQIYRQLIPHAHTTAVEDLLAIADGHRLAQSQGL